MRRARIVLALSFLLLSSLGAASAQAPRPAIADSSVPEVPQYILTMDGMTRFFATMQDFAQLGKAHPNLKRRLARGDRESESTAHMEQRVAAEPLLVATLKAHSFTPREFVVLEMAYFRSALALRGMAPGADPAKVAAEARIDPANLSFLASHKAEIQALKKAVPGSDQDAD